MEPLKILSTRAVKVVYAIDIYNITSGQCFTLHAFTKRAAFQLAKYYIFEHAVNIRKMNSNEWIVYPIKKEHEEGKTC